MSDPGLKIPSGTLYRRAMQLVCPVCGRGKPFIGWFRMNRRCDDCGYVYDREPGYFLGSIYFNYGVTGAIVILWIAAAMLAFEVRELTSLWPPAVFALVFPLWFLRYSRALFMALDLSWDPPEAKDFLDREA
ncbi:MAG: DUF983 domain-containing protein [Planctomycetes bacterium]|nr:DUF983 domain-containing protein [Planctomycetota bacterium]